MALHWPCMGMLNCKKKVWLKWVWQSLKPPFQSSGSTTVIGCTACLFYRLFFQYLNLDSRIIAIMGLIMSIVSCALIADWQSVRFDQCTNFSPYHHPTLFFSNRTKTNNVEDDFVKFKNSPNICIEDTCNIVGYFNDTSTEVYYSKVEKLTAVGHEKFCAWNNTIYLCDEGDNTNFWTNVIGPYPLDSDTSTILYKDIMMLCMQSISRNEHCHWMPNSLITQQYCSDCEPICRSPSRSLNFIQFCLGAAILMLSIPIAWVPVASMASERTSSELQVQSKLV